MGFDPPEDIQQDQGSNIVIAVTSKNIPVRIHNKSRIRISTESMKNSKQGQQPYLGAITNNKKSNSVLRRNSQVDQDEEKPMNGMNIINMDDCNNGS